jgi:hypothetical protein
MFWVLCVMTGDHCTFGTVMSKWHLRMTRQQQHVGGGSGGSA